MNIEYSKMFILFGLLGLSQPATVHSASERQAMLFCSDVDFHPRCSTNDVIVIESAIYGRKEFGQCLRKDDLAKKLVNDRKFLNCSVDVKDFLDNKCSGKQNCVVRVDSPELLNRSPCYKSIPHYLEVKFSCIYGSQAIQYCSDEYFHPHCSTNEVIAIESAIYGRKKFDKCLQRDDLAVQLAGDRRFVNCQVDVKDFLSNKCSGKQNCTVHVNDQELLNRSPCYKSIPHYLEVKHSCIYGSKIQITTSHKHPRTEFIPTTQQTLQAKQSTAKVKDISEVPQMTTETGDGSLVHDTSSKDKGHDIPSPLETPRTSDVSENCSTLNYSKYCQEGNCFLNNKKPFCRCKSGWIGERCEHQDHPPSNFKSILFENHETWIFVTVFFVVFMFLFGLIASCYVCCGRRTRRRAATSGVGGAAEEVPMRRDEREERNNDEC